jgi:biotin synthase
MADNADVPIWDTVRMIAATRILMPQATVRLSAGRHKMGFSDQALCFMAGANSIFSSEQRIMLTKAVPCADYDADRGMLDVMGLKQRPPFKDGRPDHVASAFAQSTAGGSNRESLQTAAP